MRWLRSVGLLGILAIAGCSGGGTSSGGGGGFSNSGNNNNNGSSPPAPTLTTLNFSVPLFNSTKQATLIRRNMPNSETGSSNTIISTSANKADLNETPGRDLPPEIIARQLAELNEPSTRNRALIQPRFQDLTDFNFFIATNNQTVTCRKVLANNQTQHCTIFAQVVGNTPIVSETIAQQIADTWDAPISGIYAKDRDVFGSEWTNGGGRDGDDKVVLVFLNNTGVGGSQYFGFTSPADVGTGPSSNQGEILYINFDKFGADGFDVYSTLAHEFQHLIALNTKLVRQGNFGGQIENSAIDEGKAVLAEELAGYGLESPLGGNSFTFQACRAFLLNPDAQGLFQFNGNLDSYGRDYVFMRYLLDQKGLADFRNYAQSSGTGLAQLNASFGSMSNLFTDWTNALLASPLNGSVPSNLRFTGPFNPGRTYSIRTAGGGTQMQLMPTVTPGQTVTPPQGTQTVNLGAWAFSTVLYKNGTGNTLNVQVQGLSTQGASMVVENPTGTFGGVQ
ncbi:MAG: hypothetical protein KF760_10670 [Candidatus Eremiobacteraeota bacterium]|nr:hypothetical protein [Candidatus Eremiobacteraeota bacterium]MCW5869011.1 hypothetical protein [Candidatus Eremiobacteraeota bacterium]